jgi:hypothetical protein
VRSTMRPSVMHAVLAGLVAFATSATAQERPWNLPPEAEFANRYEGLIAQQVANPDFELLSFTGGLHTTAATEDLRVDFYLADDRPVSIRAQELRDDKYYRMASKPGTWTSKAWNTFAEWPLRDVIARHKVPLSNIGVVVYLSTAIGQSGEIAPAFVYQQEKPPHRGDRYQVVFRVLRTNLKEVQYTLRRSEPSGPPMARTANGVFIRGTPVFLDVDAAALEPGRYTLEVVCVPVSVTAKPIRRDFTFHHAR